MKSRVSMTEVYPQQHQVEFQPDRFSKLLMVPHSSIWEGLVVGIIIFQAQLTIFSLTYLTDDHPQLMANVLHYFCEFITFINTVFIVLHRNFSSHKNDLCVKKEPFLLLTILILSLIPYSEVYVYLLSREASMRLQILFKAKMLLRLLKVFLFFSSQRRQSGVNQVAVIFFHSAFIFSLYLIIASSLWRSLGCYHCDVVNWMDSLRDCIYNNDNMLHQFVFPYTFIGSVLAGSYEGVIASRTSMEVSVVLATMFVAFITRGMLFMAKMTAQFISLLMKQSTFNSRLENIYNYIAKQEFDKELNNDIKDYYNQLWHKRRAIFKMPQCFQLLPLALQKEVVLDMFWDAFQHSHFFRKVSMTFKRELSMIMQSEFILAGDLLYNTDQMRYKMVYIVSGIVQILSDEDDESPILSFSSGTILGEICCLMPMRSECRLRCATYCEFITLSMPAFAEKLVVYRNPEYWAQIRNRIEAARRMNMMALEEADVEKVKPIRRLKLQWRAMKNEELPHTINEYHTSRFLDLLVLSDEMDLKVEVICLTATFPFILDPHSSFRRFCDLLCMGAAIVQFLVIPYCAAFVREISTTLRTLLLIIDFIYVFDLALQTTTAIKEKTQMIATVSGIMMRRLQELSFLVDLLATMPYDYLAMAIGSSDQVFIMCKIPRVIKVYKVLGLVHRYEKKLGRSTTMIRFIKYYLLLILITYFATCMLYMIACYDQKCEEYSWFQYNQVLAKGTISERSVHPAVRTLFVVTSLLHGAGFAASYPYTSQDCLIMFVVALIGYYLFCFAISELTSAAYWEMHEERSHKILVQTVMNFTRMQKITDRLVFRVFNMLRFRWEYNRDLVKCDATEIFDEVTPNLRERIDYQLVTKYLYSATFFQNLNDEFIQQVMHISKVILYPPHSYLCFSDQIITHIYILKRGHCICESTVPGDKERGTAKFYLSAGACFPIMEVLHEINSFITVRAVTTVEAVAIPYEKMMNYLKMNRKSYEQYINGLEIHMRENKSVLRRSAVRMNFRVRKRTKEFGEPFTYNTELRRGIRWDVRRLALNDIMDKTINPHGTFYIVCEVTRCVLSVVQFFTLVTYINILYYKRDVIDVVNFALDASVYIDMYLKTRVHYNNKRGIPVTDKKQIMHHYMRHSFILDVFSSFPYKLFSFSYFTSQSTRLVTSCMLMLLSRPLQLYRLFSGIDYLFQRSKIISEMNVVRIKFLLFLLAVLLLAANVIQLVCCKVHEDGFHCSMGPLTGGDIRNVTSANSLVIYTYVAAQYFNRFYYQLYTTQPSEFVMLFYIIVAMLFVLAGWYLHSKLASTGLHEEYMTSQLQNDRRNFKAFARTECMDVELTKDTLETNQYMTRNLETLALSMAVARFTPQLNIDFSYAIYMRAICNCRLLEHAGDIFRRHIASKMKRKFVKKDGIIIRQNDVHNQLYIVKSGFVEITVANCRLVSLGYGGMFGCFAKHGLSRQSIMAKAALHTEVLVIPSWVFHQHIKRLPLLKKKVEVFVHTNPEYIEGIVKEMEEGSIQLEVQQSFYLRFVNRLLNQNTATYRILNVVLNVHLATLSSIFTLIYQLDNMDYNWRVQYRIIFYTLDVIFALQIILGFSGLSYVDESSGVVVKDYIRILKRYMKGNFTLDVISVMPFELILYNFIPSDKSWLAASNRILRIIYLWQYHSNFRRLNKLTHCLRWTYLGYLVLFFVQFFTNVWYFVACTGRRCRYVSDLSHGAQPIHTSESPLLSILLAYSHVINSFTATGLRTTRPTNAYEIALTCVIYIASIFIVVIISSGFAVIQVIDNYSLCKYDYEIEEIKTYLQYQGLSPAVFKKVWKYYLLLWTVQNGEQLPALIENSTQYLKEDIMYDVYCHHLLDHYIFRRTHVDFLRQLMVHLKRCIFPTDYVIVEKGDIDFCMYFIHSGSVSVIERDTIYEIELYVLTKNESFGEQQGLAGTAHEATYKAKTFVDIVMLNKKDWGYLLKHFPASVEEIQLRCEESEQFSLGRHSFP